MKFTVPKEKILEELQLLQGIVEKRNTMPILANILVQAGSDEVEMTGTDLEVGLRTHFEASIEEPGAITVSGKKLFEIVKSLPGRGPGHLPRRQELDDGDHGGGERVQHRLPAQGRVSPGSRKRSSRRRSPFRSRRSRR